MHVKILDSSLPVHRPPSRKFTGKNACTCNHVNIVNSSCRQSLMCVSKQKGEGIVRQMSRFHKNGGSVLVTKSECVD